MNENEQTAVTAEVQNVPAQTEVPQTEVPHTGMPQDAAPAVQEAVPQVQGTESAGRNSETAGADKSQNPDNGTDTITAETSPEGSVPTFSEKIIEESLRKGLKANLTAETEAENAAPNVVTKAVDGGTTADIPQSKPNTGTENDSERVSGNTEPQTGVKDKNAPDGVSNGKNNSSDFRNNGNAANQQNGVSGSQDDVANGNQTTVDPIGKGNNSSDGLNKEPTDGKTGTARPVRNYEAEWKELAEAHPEVVGTTLPEDVFQACIRSDQPPLRVYESMMLQKMRDEVERLKQENDRLKQNHDNAQRAPVTGTLEGGATGVKEEDAFIAAFNRYR